MSKTATNRFSDPEITPKNPSKKDISRDWFVRFDFFDGSKWRRLKKRGGINYFHDFKTRLAEANALKAELTKLLEDGWNPLDGTMVPEKKQSKNPYEGRTFISLLEEFHKVKLSELRPTSHRNYTLVKNYLIKWLSQVEREDIPPEEFDVQMANAFMDWLAIRGISNTTWNNYKEASEYLVNMYKKRKIMEENPFCSIAKKKPNPKRNNPFTPAELKIVWDHLRKTDIYLYRFSRLMYYCYIRPAEITRIQVKEVLLNENKIFIPSSKAKNRKDGYPRIPPKLMEDLVQMDIPTYHGDYYLFGNRSLSRKEGTTIVERPENRQVITDIFRSVFKTLRITGRNLYSFKHTGVIAAYNAGVKIKAIQAQLRHHSLEETDIYLRSLGVDVNEEYLTVDY